MHQSHIRKAKTYDRKPLRDRRNDVKSCPALDGTKCIRVDDYKLRGGACKKKCKRGNKKKAEPKCRYQKQKQNHDEMRAINAAFQKKRKEGKTTERKMPESRSHIVHV